MWLVGVKTLKGLVAWSGCLTHRGSTLCSTRTSPLPSLLSGLGTGGNYGPMVANALFHCLMACQEADWPYKGPVSIEQPLDYHSPGLSGSVPGSTLVPGTGLQLTRNVSCVACGCENTKRTGCLVWLPYPQVSTLCSTRTLPLPWESAS